MELMHFRIIAFTGLFLCSLPAFSETEEGHTLTGQVMEKVVLGDSEEFFEISRILVSLIDVDSGERHLYATGSGRFVFPGLDPGTYRLEAELEGYRTAREEVEITGGDVTADLLLFPGVDMPTDLAQLPAETYELLVLQSLVPDSRSFRLQLEIRGDKAQAVRSEQLGELGEVTFEKTLADDELAQLRALLDRADPLASNHRGSYVRPPVAGYETLEVLAAGMTAILVTSGNPDFEQGAGRELIRYLHRLAETVVRRTGEARGR